ncbi:MAG: hypothetical protein IT244_13800, partial [Bacteroidia bacterium]|nr:hypothetical protein [Bacteroidia bacterium]
MSNKVVYTSNLDCATPGWYTIKMRVKNQDGDSAQYIRTIHVIKATHVPSNEFWISTDQMQVYFDVQCSSLADSGAYTWEWTATGPDGNTYTYSSKFPNITISEYGRWTICHRAKNNVGFSTWLCKNVWCIPPIEYYIGVNNEAEWDSGTLYDNGGPGLNYGNNRKKQTDYFHIKTNAIKSILNIKQLKLADTNDRLLVFDGASDSGLALHPKGGFTVGSITKLPAILISNSGEFFIQFYSNGSGTDSGFILSWKTAGSEKIYGKIFYDSNKNNQFDLGTDKPFRRYGLKLTNSRSYKINNDTGEYFFHNDTSTQIITPSLPNGWTFEKPVSGVHTWKYGINKSLDFIVKPDTQIIKDLKISNNSLAWATLRGVKSTLKLNLENNGNTSFGNIKCTIKSDRKLNSLKLSSGNYNATDTSLNFTTSGLGLLSEKNIQVEYVVKNTDTGTVAFKCNCYTNIVEKDSLNNEFITKLKIVNAHDPNDKQASEPERMKEKPGILKYLVRFQNTGNWPATTVIVRDTLSPNLDTNSFEL